MTCLILTKNRPHWLPFAVRQAQYQTYKSKEILIVADGEDVKDLIPNDPQIRYIHAPDFGTIGSKRNFGCSHARGEVVAHFDDDDFSGPQRVSDQVEQLCKSVAKVSGYHTLRFTDGQKWWRYHLRPDYVPGTTLCYWKSFWQESPFPEKQINEDGDFVQKARSVLTATDAGDLMFATIHDQNTSPRNLNTAQWKEISA